MSVYSPPLEVWLSHAFTVVRGHVSSVDMLILHILVHPGRKMVGTGGIHSYVVLLAGFVRLLSMEIEQGRTCIWLGAFAQSKYFVRLKTRLSSTTVELHLLVVLGLNDVSAHHLSYLFNPIVQRCLSAGLVKLFSLGLN